MSSPTPRLLFAVVAAALPHLCAAVTHKCVAPDGKVQYQSQPCDNGRAAPLRSAPPVDPPPPPARAASASETKRCTGREVTLNFPSMPLVATLQVLADYSGNKLSVAPGVGGSGAFHYQCVPWDAVLQDIALKHGLDARVDNGTIRVSRK